MQNYEAQGGIVKGKQQSVRGYCGNLQNNTDVLRSNFSGDNFPDSPVEGQHCYRTDLEMEFIYTQNGWVENDENSTVSRELQAARGSHDNLKARLDVALNDDGTLKAGAEINMNEWKQSLMTPTYLDESRFYVPNDVESVFTVGRALKITGKDKPVVTYVDSSKYDVDYNRTIVTVTEAVITSGISTVELSIIQHSMPKTAATVKQIRENTEEIYKHNHTEGKGEQIPTQGIASEAITTEKIAKGAVTGERIAQGTITADKLDPRVLSSSDLDSRSTGFKSHVASGMGLEIDPVEGYPKVTEGRAYASGKYCDMYSDKVLKNIKNQRGLVYAERGSNGATIGFKPFVRPYELPQIKNIPADDLRFMTDFEVPEDNPQEVIKDLSGGDCNLTATGANANLITAHNHTGWTVPAGENGNKAGWFSGAKTWKGIKAEPWSMMFYFIPVNGNSFFPFSFYTTKGYAWNVYFELTDYRATDNTWAFGVYNNRYENTSAGVAGVMMRVFKNKPNLVVYEIDENSSSIYINGVLVWRQRTAHTFVEGTEGQIGVNIYANTGTNYIGNIVPLFACIRNGNWGETAIAQMANQMGVPNEYVGLNAKLPSLYNAGENSERYKSYHAWAFDEEDGNTIYDTNTVSPIHGVMSQCVRVQSDAREGKAVTMGGTGSVSFGNHALGDEFSFFILATIYADGTVASVYNGNYEGFILQVNSRALRLHQQGWIASSNRNVPFGTPCLIGVSLKKSTGECCLYVDSTDPQHYTFTPSKTYSNSAPFFIGEYSNAVRANMTVHAALMADRLFTDSELKAIFKAFNTKTRRGMAEDMGLSDKAIIGMVKTDKDGKVEQAETYPRWGRRINPYKNKYFLGWYANSSTGELVIPNLYGSSRVKVNVYAQLDLNSPVMTSIGSWSGDSTSTTVVSGRTSSSTTVKGFRVYGVNANAISYYYNTSIGSDMKALLNNRVDGSAPWIGFEVEPMADNDDVDSVDY